VLVWHGTGVLPDGEETTSWVLKNPYWI